MHIDPTFLSGFILCLCTCYKIPLYFSGPRYSKFEEWPTLTEFKSNRFKRVGCNREVRNTRSLPGCCGYIYVNGFIFCNVLEHVLFTELTFVWKTTEDKQIYIISLELECKFSCWNIQCRIIIAFQVKGNLKCTLVLQLQVH